MADKSVGRHSADSQSAFYRSAALWFLPWVVVAVVALAAVWIAIDALGGNEVSPTSVKGQNQKKNGGAPVDPTPAETEETTEPEEIEEPTPSPEPSKSSADKDEDEDEANADKPKLITDGVSVQVLNGTSDAEADDRVAEQLEHLGYDVIAVNPYLSRPDTIVYFSSEESKKAAEALGAHFEWPVEPMPEDLSSEVDVHVIVGADELVAGD